MGFKNTYLKNSVYPYFIAEIGINHNGEIEIAKRMIDESINAGADAVKFQKRHIPTLVNNSILECPTGYLSKDEYDIQTTKKEFGTWTYPDSRLEFSDSDFLEIWRYAEDKGIDFISSYWDETSIDFAVDHGARIIKLASIDATNYQFCEYIADKRIPTIVSTGMTTYEELFKTFKIFKTRDCPIMFLHCTSSYPSSIEDKNLKCITILRNLFDTDIGFSGHGSGIEGTLGAVALGANVIEKHVTLNKEMNGPDHAASITFGELANLIKLSRNMTKALGNGHKTFLESEKTLHKVLSKKFITIKNISAMDRITPNNIRTVVTSGDGILPNRYYDILNRQVCKNLEANHVLTFGDLIE